MAEIQTVLGPIDATNLGLTSMHEHILYDGRIYRQRFVDMGLSSDQDNIFVKANDEVTLENISLHKQNFNLTWDGVSMHDEQVMTAEMTDFKTSGGSAMIDVSVPGLRTDITASKRISEKSGVHIIATTGLYSEDCWPEKFRFMSTAEYRNYMLDEIENGIDGTDIKPGHLKLAVEGAPSEQEIKMLHALAEVSGETGLSVSIHHGVMMEHDQVRKIMDIVEEAGIDPSRTLMCHMQNSLACNDLKTLAHNPASRDLELDFNKEVMDRGFIAGHDCFGHDYKADAFGWQPTAEWQMLVAIYELCKAGYANRIVLGTDTFMKILTRRFGGGGYCHLTNSVLPNLEMIEVSKADIEQMTIKNPERILVKPKV